MNLCLRSIFSAKSVMEKGTRWLVGNGAKSNIWSDSWLPEPEIFKVAFPINTLDAEAIVSELIVFHTRKSNHNLVFNCFNRYVAKKIITIPISWRFSEDRIIWN